MTCIETHCMERNPHVLSERLSAYLRRRTNAKGLARSIGCDPRTAENVLSGHWPNARHWLGIVSAFGADVTEAVFHPQDAVARLETEVERLERELADIRARAAEAQGFAPCRAGTVAAARKRAAQ
jgi:hypothetical protein